MLTAAGGWTEGRAQRGFTLIELMVTVMVVGTLAAIALPAYQDQVRKSRRVDAYDALLHIQTLQEKWRANNSAYTDSLTDLGAGGAISPQGYYTLELDGAGSTGYTLRAQATEKGRQSSDAGCTSITLTINTGNPRGSRSPSGCW